MISTQTYPFSLPPLPYAYDALEPYIDRETMHFHHDKHMKTYVDNLNKALEPYPQYHHWTLERLLLQLDELPDSLKTSVRNNGGRRLQPRFIFHPDGSRRPAAPRGGGRGLWR